MTPDVGSRLALMAALARLSAGERAVVVLRYFEDLTEAETARTLDLRIGTVRSLHHRALKKLRVSDELSTDAEDPLTRCDRGQGARRS